MSDGVKFIFKTLIKVPCIIVAAFGIFNIFAFCMTYFQMLGLSYVVMQTAVENNYLPNTEINILNDHLKAMETSMVRDLGIVIKNDGTVYEKGKTYPSKDIAYATAKRQYGKVVTVGVTCDYVFVWPMDYRTPKSSGPAGAYGVRGYVGDMGVETENNISIVYTVPGLKYYPDMLIR